HDRALPAGGCPHARARGRGGGGGRRLPRPAPLAVLRGGRLRRELRLLPRLRSRPVLRGARAGTPLPGRGRPLRSPWWRHPDGRGRARGRARGHRPAPRGDGALRPQVEPSAPERRAWHARAHRQLLRPSRREGTGMIPFAKGHGLGNDYIVIDGKDLPGPLTVAQTARICDRNWGVGSDGILLKVPAWAGADFGLRILNPDGSEAEKSGNGLRIFAKYLWEHDHTKEPVFTVDTKGGRVQCHCHVVDGRMNLVTVEMGSCTFLAPEIPMNGPAREVVRVPLQVGTETLTVTAVSVGNPHCVVFVDKLDEERC